MRNRVRAFFVPDATNLASSLRAPLPPAQLTLPPPSPSPPSTTTSNGGPPGSATPRNELLERALAIHLQKIPEAEKAAFAEALPKCLRDYATDFPIVEYVPSLEGYLGGFQIMHLWKMRSAWSKIGKGRSGISSMYAPARKRCVEGLRITCIPKPFLAERLELCICLKVGLFSISSLCHP